ncbi:hypothetical protein FWK35_00003337, partial [Aphis craccivora]
YNLLKYESITIAIPFRNLEFYDFSTSKLLAIFRVFDRFPTIKITLKEPCIKFSNNTDINIW